MSGVGGFTLVVYTDAHGRYTSVNSLNFQKEPHGLDRLLTRIKQLSQKGQATLVIDNGDSIQGMPLVDLYQPESGLEHPVNQLHQALGVEVFVPGNHEFNFGLAGLELIRAHSNAHWLSANIIERASGKTYFRPYQIFQKGGLRVGVLGLITEFVPRWEHESQIPGLDFLPIVAQAKRWVPEIKAQCDLLVVSYHGGTAKDPLTGDTLCYDARENEGLELIEQVPGIDLLLCGHQHRRQIWQSPQGALLVQAGNYGRCWAEIEVTGQPGAWHLAAKLVQAQDFEPDPSLCEIFEPEMLRVRALMEEPLGTAEPDFAITDPLTQVWTQKHPMIQWINQLIQERTGAPIVCTSLLDAGLPGLPPLVHLKDLIANYFFQDNLCVVEVTGEVLILALEQVASFFILNGKTIEVNPEWGSDRIRSYNYDIFDGIEYSFDLTRPIGTRLTELTYAGKPIQPLDRLKVGLTTYRAQGAFYQMFSGEQIIEEFPEKITELMVNSIRSLGHLKITPVQNFHILY